MTIRLCDHCDGVGCSRCAFKGTTNFPKPQILGPGKADFELCDECTGLDDICWRAKACLRQKAQT